MTQVLLNVLMSASIISVALWIAKTNPNLGGFILSLPLSTLIALAFSKMQNQDVSNTMLLAKSIFVAVPLTLLFFIPFLFAEKMKLSFWSTYLIGFGFLLLSYFIHKWIAINWWR